MTQARLVFLYAVVTVIWSTTWYGIKLQTNGTHVAISVGLRFAVASLLLFAYLLATRQHRVPAPAMRGILLQGFMFFGVGYLFEYAGTEYLTSGLVALIFSAVTLFNILNEWAWFGIRPARATLLAAGVGILGLGLIFAKELSGPDPAALMIGGLLVLAGAYMASCGNVLGGRLLTSGTSVVALNTYAMMTGAAVSLAWATLGGHWGSWIITPDWLAAMLYLAIFGSVVAFGLYFLILREIGASRAGYVAVAVPAFALLVSTFLENYHWNWLAAAGLFLVIAGNALVLRIRAERNAAIKETCSVPRKE